MIVGVSNKQIDGKLWEYSLECPEESDESKGFCGHFSVVVFVHYEKEAFRCPESVDTKFDWESLEMLDTPVTTEEERIRMLAWIKENSDELESLWESKYTKIETK